MAVASHTKSLRTSTVPVHIHGHLNPGTAWNLINISFQRLGFDRKMVDQAENGSDLHTLPSTTASLDKGPPGSGIYTLYGAQISNYTAKVRSYLIYKGVPFQEVVASNQIYDKLLVPVIGYRTMPILRKPDGGLLQDSTDIIDYLERQSPDASVYPSTPTLHLANLLLESYAHDWVRIPAMYYRWGFPDTNDEYLKAEFGRMYEPMAQPGEQIFIGDKACAWTRDRLPSLGVTAATIPEVEQWMENLLRWLDTHFSEHDYLFGSRPSTADFTFMGPLYGHMYRDPYSFALMSRICPNVIRWVERMNSPPERVPGSYFASDEIPKTLLPLLRHLFAEYVPVAYDTIDRVSHWINANPSSPVPRFLECQDFHIGGITAKRTVWTCIQYMFQRPLFYYQNTFGRAKQNMDTFLRRLGRDISLDKTVYRPVKHENYRLVADVKEVYKLYGTQSSYYTAKVRGYLTFKKIPFEEILATAEIYESVIVRKTGVWMIPVLISPDGVVLQDSTEIIDFLELRFTQAPVYPASPKQKLATLILELMGDEWLIMTAIYYRWTKDENRAFAVGQFGEQAKPDASPQEQHEAGLEKVRVFSSWVDSFGIDDITGPAIEEAYEELLNAFQQHLEKHEYLFGSRPSLADFSFFGGLSAVLQRDPYSGRLMAGLAPRVQEWVERLRRPQRVGSFADGDEIPETLLPLLKMTFSDFFPVLQETVSAVKVWIGGHPGQALPKTIGTHDFVLRGRRGTRHIFPYSQWMLQRVLDFYKSLTAAERPEMDRWVAGLGGLGYMNMTIDCRVKRENYKLSAD